DVHVMSRPEDLFLTIERYMVAELIDDHRGDEPGSGEACILQRRRQGGDHRRVLDVVYTHKLQTHSAAAEKASRLVIELFADLLPDLTPLLRVPEHIVRHNG